MEFEPLVDEPEFEPLVDDPSDPSDTEYLKRYVGMQEILRMKRGNKKKPNLLSSVVNALMTQ